MKIFYLPDLGEGLAEAEVREWYVKEGDVVTVDQPLVSMETAKAVVDVPSPYAGKLVKLHGDANTIIKTGAPFVTYEIEGATEDKGSVVGKLETSENKWDDTEVLVGTQKTKSSTSIKAMPAARVLANQLQVDLSLVIPTGPQGLITPQDVKNFLSNNKGSEKNVSLGDNTEALHGVRRAMAQVMSQSHQEVVPVTIVDDVDLTNLPPKSDITVLLLKAMAKAAATEPSLNAWYNGKAMERKLFKEMHIGLAVDTPEGLFVPVIKNVETLSDSALRQKIDEYKTNVKNRSISPKDLQGATITLSNFGVIAGRYATPIIVPPAVAILGCGRSREVVIPKDGKMIIGRMMPLSLTFDHRAVTGGEAIRFLGTIIKYLQEA